MRYWITVGIFAILITPLSWNAVMAIEEKTYKRTLACKLLEKVLDEIGPIISERRRLDAEGVLHQENLYCIDGFRKSK